jgi:hypothetical protein
LGSSLHCAFWGSETPIFHCAGGEKKWRKSGTFITEKTVTGRCGRSDRTWQARPVSSNLRQMRAQGGRILARSVPRGTSASGRTPFGTVLVVELIGRVARPVTCDRTRPVAVGALWTPTGRRVQRVRSNVVARPVTATAPSDVHCCCLSCSDWTRPVTLTGASGHYVFHCVVR